MSAWIFLLGILVGGLAVAGLCMIIAGIWYDELEKGGW